MGISVQHNGQEIDGQTAWVYITPTHLLEYLFCPRFTYYEFVLGVPEHQEKRFKVQKGRLVHDERKRINKTYFRKKLGVVARKFDMELNCMRLHIRGIVDEVLTLEDGTMAPFDYKYAEHKKKTFRNHKIQAALYGLLIRETYDKPVNRAFLCYTRSKYYVETIDLTEAVYAEALDEVQNCLQVIQRGVYPPATTWSARCVDCCYKNICVQ